MTTLRVFRHALKSFLVPPFFSGIFRTTPHEPVVKASLHSLPNELLLEIFAFLELKPYIISHGICKKWRQLLPLTKLHPTRQRLLDLYHRILETPDFQKTLEWTNKNLQEFDREEYISSLLSQYPTVPEEFRMWILEWPARLVIQCTWPGLPFVHSSTPRRLIQRLGVNWIAYRSFSPRLLAVVYKSRTPSRKLIPGLFIWRHATEVDWLIFEQDEPDVFGRVFTLDQRFHNLGIIPYYPRRTIVDSEDEDSESESEMSEGEEYLTTFDDWICYLEFLWHVTSVELLNPRPMYSSPDPLIAHPVLYRMNAVGSAILPSPGWETCQRSQHS